jgi:hypothetical protein
LAGSEKLDGEHDPERIREAKFINKSLSALATVINSIKEINETGINGKSKRSQSIKSNKN